MPRRPSDSSAAATASTSDSSKTVPSTFTSPPQHEHEGEADDESESDDDDNEDSVWYTPHELRDILDRAKRLKGDGNTAFGKGEWETALRIYRSSLSELPVRTNSKGKGRATATITKDDEGEEVDKVALEQEEKDLLELGELRSTIYANIAATLIKLERWGDAVLACDGSLEDQPLYVKALHRRAMANEAIGSWSSLTTSLEDYTTLSKLDTLSPSDLKSVTAAMIRVPVMLTRQQEKEKDEVLGKLKDLGNNVLGRFGLSLDNFKMAQNESGGYSMSMQ